MKMDNQIIVIEQLPVISEKLMQIKEEVTEKVAVATALVCTEETVKEVKKAKALKAISFTDFGIVILVIPLQ